MSIAGIGKEVATISLSAVFFHDQLTPLNVVGIAVTVCGVYCLFLLMSFGHLSARPAGIALYTFHKYQKSLEATIPLDPHGNPIEDEGLDGDGHVELGETEHLARRTSRDSYEQFERVSLSFYLLARATFVELDL
jgi:solute carrier family 35, member C2